MDKNYFCKHWVEEKDNPLFKELAEAFGKLTKELLQTQSDLGTIKHKYKSEIESIEKEHASILDQKREEHESLGRKIIANIYDDKRIYDALEEEFTLDFIIKVKLQENMELEEHERLHLLEKL